MTKRQARACAAPAPDAAKPAAVPGAGKPDALKHDPAVIAPLRLYSVYLLGMFAMGPGPARGGK